MRDNECDAFVWCDSGLPDVDKCELNSCLWVEEIDDVGDHHHYEYCTECNPDRPDAVLMWGRCFTSDMAYTCPDRLENEGAESCVDYMRTHSDTARIIHYECKHGYAKDETD
jgi:hypothetical protein